MRGRAAALAAGALLLAACEAAERQPSAPPAVAAAAAPVGAAASPAGFPALTGRVVDQAELLSPDDEAGLTSELAGLERRTGDQLVIVTVRSLNGLPIEDFARSLGNHWGVGQADRDNGVLIVVAPDQRTTRIQVGYGLEPILTDRRAKRIVERDLLPHFRDGRWSAGLRAGTRSIIATLIEHEHAPRRGRR